MAENEGLKIKYNISKVSDGSMIHNCFVLRPDKYPAAVAALTAYAQATENRELAADILNWINPDKQVLRLPCKVGDKVHIEFDEAIQKRFQGWTKLEREQFDGSIVEDVIASINLVLMKDTASMFIRTERFNYSFTMSDFGKIVYLAN